MNRRGIGFSIGGYAVSSVRVAAHPTTCYKISWYLAEPYETYSVETSNSILTTYWCCIGELKRIQIHESISDSLKVWIIRLFCGYLTHFFSKLNPSCHSPRKTAPSNDISTNSSHPLASLSVTSSSVDCLTNKPIMMV